MKSVMQANKQEKRDKQRLLINSKNTERNLRQ